MGLIVLMLLFIAILFVLWVLQDRIGFSAPPFRRRDYLLTRAERSFFEVLCRSLDNSLIVFPKVRLADLLWLPSGTANRLGWWNRVRAKHIDFILCGRSLLNPALAIELDDSSHELPSRRARDQVVNAVLEAAHLPLLRIPVKREYAADELRQLVRDALSSAGAGATPRPRMPAPAQSS